MMYVPAVLRHVKKTGEIGMLKLVNMVNYKGGERITMLCGVRALKDYEAKDANGKEISALLCAKELEIADAVHHMKEEQTAKKQSGRSVRKASCLPCKRDSGGRTDCDSI